MTRDDVDLRLLRTAIVVPNAAVFPGMPVRFRGGKRNDSGSREKQHHRPFTMALVYCLGIMGTFTGLGMLMSIIFGASALHPRHGRHERGIGHAALAHHVGPMVLRVHHAREHARRRA